MAFNDSHNDVKSLLALLKSTQDGTSNPSSSSTLPAEGQNAHTQAWQLGAGARRTSSSPANAAAVTSSQHTHSTYGTSSVIPTQRQLDDLLASLNNGIPQPQTQPSSSSSSSSANQSAFSGPRRDLIQPFGPMRDNHGRGLTSSKSFDHLNLPPAHRQAQVEAGPSRQVSNDQITGSSGSGSVTRYAKRRDEPGYSELGFTKALPIISDLLGDEGFRKQLKKMKSDQDALERRLWAKQERLKADHDKAIQPEKEIARISRKPIALDRQAQWKVDLETKLAELYRSFLPTIDGLALRQKDSLEELGVPGLGGDVGDEKVRARVKRIMDLLQAGLEED